MKRPLNLLINDLLERFGFQLVRRYPERQAIIEAKKHFGRRELVACEIGTFAGKHALEMCRHLNLRKLYLIDPYTKYGYIDDAEHRKIQDARRKAHALLQGYEDRIVWLEKYSDEAVGDIAEELDFVYIDGNHYSPYVDNDIRNYYPLVKDGGIISGHDYSWLGFPDVVKAVHDFMKRENKEMIFGREQDWVVFK